MTQFFTYDGVDLGNASVRLEEGVPGFTSNADGSFGVGGLRIDDPTGALTFTQLQEFSHNETACSQPRTFTGYLWNMRVGRGPYRSGAGRVYDFDFADLNWLLTLQPLRGSTAKRPVETGDQRLAWLLASVALSGIVFDNGLVGSNTNSFDEADYRNRLATEVLADLCVSSSADTGRIFFVYRDNASGEPSLFIDRPSVATYTSTLEISNDLADVDNVTTFAPYMNVELEAGGEEIFCSVFFVYKTGQIYVHNATTHATYFAGAGFHRQAVFQTDRIGSAVTAQRHAESFLASHAGTLDTVTVPIKLPASKVNLVEAGMRIRNKFTHLPAPFNSYGYLRVAQRTVALTPGTNDHYDLTLKLTNRTISPVGGGDPGDFPQPGCAAWSLVQQATPGAEPDLASPPSAGNLLVIIAAQRGTTVPIYTGFTTAESVSTTGSDSGGTFVYYKIADGTEANIPDANPSDQRWVWYMEWNQAGTLGNTSDRNQASAATILTTSIAAGTGSLVFAAFQQAQGAMTIALDAGFGLTSLGQSNIQGSDQGPHTVAGYSLSTTGAYAPTATPSNIGFGRPQASVLVAFACSNSADPPAPGQVVPWTVVTMAGAVGTTEFPYADGSLLVKVDGLLISTASYTETDPAAGTFTLSWTPDTDEVVTVQYIGR